MVDEGDLGGMLRGYNKCGNWGELINCSCSATIDKRLVQNNLHVTMILC